MSSVNMCLKVLINNHNNQLRLYFYIVVKRYEVLKVLLNPTNNLSMQPTYSLADLKYLLRKLEAEEINILKQVLAEEVGCYTTEEYKVINKMVELRMRFLTRHKITIGSLLSFN